ncbi:nucleoside hydrolase [Paenibacillus wulumuqiensis]|uniref:nucleoside hydrolase n=1 Tax=Paenibacillus wulumuqiensis TaxID=1567107 RepID=UPI0009E2CFE7|nr:nucleoside hydrolase [Paenibacillus wulumuqiensis]
MMKFVILDVDTGIDDSLALAYAAHSPELELLGITTVFGNISVEEATRNTLVVLEQLDQEIPVYPGEAKPLSRDYTKPFARHIHGEDGIGNQYRQPAPRQPEQMEAAEFIVQQIQQNPGQVTVIAVGPLTNIARAIQQQPEIVGQIGRLVVMGGAVTVPGNVTPFAEANIYSDPDAAALVLGSGMPITLVGLDVTMRTLLTADHLEEWRRTNSELALFLANMTDFYMEAYKGVVKSGRGCALHDPLAVGVAIDPSFVRTASYAVQVECTDPDSLGKTTGIHDTPAVHIDVALDVDADRFLEHFLSRVI